jgi:hypothetical protein
MVTPGWCREVDGLCGWEETSQEGTSNTKGPSTGKRLDDSNLFAEGHGLNIQMQQKYGE